MSLQQESNVGGGSDFNLDDTNSETEDIMAAEVRAGGDIQGFDWESIGLSRTELRLHKMERLKKIMPKKFKDYKITAKEGSYYGFRRNSYSVAPKFMHTQLRNMIWATSKHDVYYHTPNGLVMHWSSLTRTTSKVFDITGETYLGSPIRKASTIAVKDKLLVVGGFDGELICKHIERQGISYCTRVEDDRDAVTRGDMRFTTSIEIYTSSSGAVHFMASNFDCSVRDYDVENLQQCKQYHLPWPVMHASLSPNGELLLVVGDAPGGAGALVDRTSGREIEYLSCPLRGNASTASAWHPSGLTFATAGEDGACRIWDIRNLSKSVVTLMGNTGFIYSIRYSSDGRFMATAENEDFVHVYDLGIGYDKEQEIDFFGWISGISFSPDSENLFVGMWDGNMGSLFEFARHRDYLYYDTFI